MAKAALNKNGIATKGGEITVYNFDVITGEYLSETVELLVVGVGIPASSCTDAPPAEKKGFAVCRTAASDGWEYIEDHRGETVYSTETGQPVGITAPGSYADGVTVSAPSTPFDRWNGQAWVMNKEAQQEMQVRHAGQTKAGLLSEAQSTISLWQTGLQLGIISDEDKASLITWMTYIQALNAVDISTAPDIDWPLMPE
jgi:hypothetical protein